ncbi:MAG: hypothetical protein HN736_08185 [Anaerolineae bacterium]|mgnify:CR=1 FL=1|nr:hypothetical protein [Anaerolineae bacterium]MBT4131990.1 hypothetical protein [Candidatus Neomarinimicrobiota bacterium]MBT3713845.1 hypothetical protein [Anaerolineae bacterium]MBT4308939.1 hypothetical protein [Anaerolineae bacterium]MBT4457387.1 hypothetical protein [Anaerolineae bacterium]
MAVKILMTWDISQENEQQYFEFVISELIPGVQRLGFHPLDAWATLYGDYPQIQVGMMAPDAESAQNALDSDGWETLREKLFEYIDNFSYKIVPARSGFQF